MLISVAFIPIARGEAPDEDDLDVEVQEARQDVPVNLPANPESEPCGVADQLSAEVALGLERNAAFVSLPAFDEAQEWQLVATLYYGPHRIRWTQDGDPETSVELVVPAEAYVDGFQREWVSRVRVEAVAIRESGGSIGSVFLPELYVVWDGGAPRWLDEAAKAVEAPLGAWSAGARATLGQLDPTRFEGPVEVDPPTGGAL